MTITVTPESAVLGATITGVGLAAPLDPTTVAEFREALLRHQVLFFPEAGLAPQQQIALGRNFGPVQVNAVLDGLADAPEVAVFDTAMKSPVAEWWHADVTCAPAPPMGAILQIVIARWRAVRPIGRA